MKRVVLILIIISFTLAGSRAKEAAFTQADITDGTEYETNIKDTVLVSESMSEIIKKGNADFIDSYKSEPIRVKIIAAGDLMCLYAQLIAARKKGEYKFDYCFDEIRDTISEADLAICNFETLVAKGYKYTGRSPAVGSPKLNAPESYLRSAVDCGFDVFINANNHILDRRVDGLDKTIKALDKYGVMHTGAYATGEARSPLIADVKGIKIAVLSYTDHINGHPKNAGMADKYSEDLVKSDISAAKAEGADYIIVYMHWGAENTHKISKAQKKAAAFIAGAGADIIIGSHPHCTQGTQIIETGQGPVPVFYSLGNLISSMCRTINRDSVLVNIALEKNTETGMTTLAALTYTPTYCAATSEGRFVIMPAGLDYIAKSVKAKALKYSRARTIKVLSDTVAVPE